MDVLRIAFLLGLSLIGCAGAVPQYTNHAAFYLGDSFSAAYNWQQFVTNVPNLTFRWQFNYAENGKSLGHAVSNQWAAAKAMMGATNFPAKIIFCMIGVNPGDGTGYVDPPVYHDEWTNQPGVYPKALQSSATNWCNAWSNMVWEAHQSNAVFYAFAVTECDGRSTYVNLFNWPYYYSRINTFLLTSGIADWTQDNETLLPYSVENYPDTLHPGEAGYRVFATNVVQTLSREVATVIGSVSGRAALGGRLMLR